MKRLLAISLSLAMVFALFGAMAVSVSADTATRKLTADDLSFRKGLWFSSNVTKTVGSDGDDYLVKFANVDLSGSGKYFGINIPQDVFDLNVKKITYSLRMDQTVQAGHLKLFMYSTTNSKNEQNPINNDKANVTAISDMLFTANETAEISVDCEANPDVVTGKRNSLCFLVYTPQSGVKAAIDVLSVTVEYESEEPAEPTIAMASGAAMRLDGRTNGIRFTATVDKTAFDAAVADATVTEIGTLIAKEGTALENVVVENAVEVNSADVELAEGQIPVAKYAKGTTMQTIESADAYEIVGSLIEIKESHANTKFVARAYVKYTDASGDHVLYADALSDARSIAQVASSFKTAGDGVYDSLCDDHKAVVDGWADKYAE